MAGGKKQDGLTIEERLEVALVPEDEQPYEVPENWCWVRLHSVCEYMRAGGDKPEHVSENKTEKCSIPIVANGIQDEGIIGYTDIANEKPGTVTVSGRGTIGYSIVRNYSYFPVIRLIVLSPNKAIHPKYLKFIFDYLEEEGTGSSIPQLTVPVLKKKILPLPPLAEQQRIVERIENLFSQLDEAQDKAQEALDDYEARNAALYRAAFSGELTRRWREDNGKDYAWNKVSFDEVADIQSNLVEPAEYQDFPHIAPDNIEKRTGVLLEYNTVAEDKVKSGKHRFYPGQILYSKIRPYLSKVVMVDFDGLCSADMYPIRAKGNTKFLYYQMLSDDFLEQASSAGSRSVLPKINQKELSKIKMVTTSEEEQEEVARVLDDILPQYQTARESIEMVIEKIENLKKTILAKAFRGELGTNNPEEESAIELLKQVLEAKE